MREQGKFPIETQVPLSQSRLQTAQVISVRLGLSVARVYDLVRRGLLPAVRIGRQLRFDENQISSWVEGGGTALDETPKVACKSPPVADEANGRRTLRNFRSNTADAGPPSTEANGTLAKPDADRVGLA